MTSQPHAIRDATPHDLPAITAIYDREVRDGTATFDTEPPPIEHWLAKLAASAPGEHFLVATDPTAREIVLGYAYSTTYRPRAAYACTREVSVYLTPDAAGRGLGRALYGALLERLTADGIHTAVAVIALPNPASEKLHAACGFEKVGVLPEVGQKFDRWIDTAFYARVLTPDQSSSAN